MPFATYLGKEMLMRKKMICLVLSGGLVAASLAPASTVFAAQIKEKNGASSTESTAATDTTTTAPAAAAEAANHGVITDYTLEKTGTAENQSGMYVNYDALIYGSGSGGKLVFENGSSSDEVVDFDALGDYYILRNDSFDNNVNAAGLFAADGTQLIPYEAAIIEWLDTSYSYTDDTAPHRFVEVTYSDGLADDSSEAYFYVYSGYFSTAPSEDDVLYKGHGRIFDTETRQFVPNIELTNPALDVYECGDSIVIGDGNVVTMYDANGNELVKSGEGYYNYASSCVGNGIFMIENGTGYVVYDDTGKELYTSENIVSLVSSTSGYLRQYTDDSLYIILDSTGKQVLPGKYDYVSEESCGYITVGLEDGSGQIIKADGTVIAEGKDAYSFYSIIPGYYYTEEGSTYSLYGPSGLVKDGISSYPSNLCVYDGTTALVVNTGAEMTLPGSTVYDVTYGLVTVKDDVSGLYGLYNLLTGAELLPCEYDDIDATDYHVYAQKGDNWDIYSINPVYAK